MELRTIAVRDSDDYPNVLGLNRNDDRDWLNSWNANPENRWNRENVFVFLAPQISLFSRYHYKAGVCLLMPLIQPPSIFPNSFRRSESAIYFLLSKAFISQAI